MKTIYKYTLALLLLVFISNIVLAQRNRRNEYQFKDTTALSPVKAKYQNEDAVEIKNVKIFEFKGFAAYTLHKTVYKLIRINTDIGMKEYNKMAIPMWGVKEILDIQVRFISPTGKVTTLHKSDLHKIENLEGYGDFTVFAIKGGEVGGEVEFKYSLNMLASYSHLEVYYNKYPIQESRFELVAPSGFNVYIQPYNGFPELTVDSEGRQAWYADIEDIEPFEEEKLALNNTHRMKVGYAVMSTGGLSKQTYSMWNDKKEEVVSYAFAFERREIKKAQEVYNTFYLNEASLEEKIHYIKTFALEKIEVDRTMYYGMYAALEYKKVYRESQKTRILAILLQAAEIEYEFVLTSNKYRNAFLKDYPFSFNMNKSLFYFPKIGLFLDPVNEMYPLGVIPSPFVGGQGLFVNQLKRKHIDTIHALDTSRTQEIYNIEVVLDPELKANIKIESKQWSYDAAYNRTLSAYLNEKYKEKYLEEYGLANLADGILLNSKTFNDSLKWNEYPPAPHIIHLELSSDMLVDKAGDDFLLKIGLLLKPAMNLYKEEERRQDIILDYPIKRTSQIKVNIPESFEIVNLEILNETIEYVTDNGDVNMSLKTSYRMIDQTLIYQIEEFDIKGEYSHEEYADIRRIINATADLAYKTLVFQKIKK